MTQCICNRNLEGEVRDVCLHYFGCLPVAKRSEYYNGLPRHHQNHIIERAKEVREVRDTLEQDEENAGLLKEFTNSMAMFREFPKSISQYTREPETQPINEKEPTIPDSCDGMSAHMVVFKSLSPYRDPSCPQAWPDQMLPLRHLLHDKSPDTNPLVRPCEPDMIRWFHLPSNNMAWVEEAVSRYYHEERPILDQHLHPREYPSKSYMLLRHEYWRGQQQGGADYTVHARYMKPRCDIISTDPEAIDASLKNLVLYMPYLHWDTHRKTTIRSRVAKALEEELRAAGEFEKPKQPRKSKPLGVSSLNSFQTDPVPDKTSRKSLKRLISSTASPTQFQKHNGPCLRIIGKVLLTAAALFEKMEYYRDEMSLKAANNGKQPLHLPRTLHQYRYGTKKSTEKLDKSQVVYRQTAPSKEYLHHPACGEENQRKCQHGHCEVTDNKGRDCHQCFSDSRKLPRLLMVDQLWLWILDGHTIITSFPQSWGHHSSSVHKSIRMRLKTILRGEIRSAYDLALIIIDQCSALFFERTQLIGAQPQVIDMFADAISNISHKQNLASTHFWNSAAEASRVLCSRDEIDTTKMYKLFLGVSREGKLLGEIKGILDEVDIMLQIQYHQKRVLKAFSKHVARLLGVTEPLLESAKGERPYKNAEHILPRTPRLIVGRELSGDHRVTPAENTMLNARELTESLGDHISELDNLKEGAFQISTALERLVDLKLQQASVVQAQEASDETLKQGRSILLFTVITIIFLPLSFVASVFSMSSTATDFRNGLMTLREEFIYMFPTSISFAAVVLIITLNTTARGMIVYFIEIPWTWFITRTKLDIIWEALVPNGRSLREKSKRRIRDMKARANLARSRNAESRAKREIIRIQTEAIKVFEGV